MKGAAIATALVIAALPCYHFEHVDLGSKCNLASNGKLVAERTGLGAAAIASAQERGLQAAAKLLRAWGGGSHHHLGDECETSRATAPRVLVAGDSIMDQFHQILLCTAHALGCYAHRRPITIVTKDDGDKLCKLAEIPPMGFANNSGTQGVLVPHTLECPTASLVFGGRLSNRSHARPLRIELTYLRFYELGDDPPGHPRNPLMMAWPTMRRLLRANVRAQDYVYANLGHAFIHAQRTRTAVWFGLQVNNFVAANQNLSSAPCTAHGPGPHAFLVGHPPQHFNTSSGAFNQSDKGPFSKQCRCGAPLLAEQPAARHDNAVAAAVTKSQLRHAPARKALVPVAYLSHFSAFEHASGRLQSCKLHRAPQDCTHYIVHPGVWSAAFVQAADALAPT